MSGTLPRLNGTHPSGEQPEEPAETKNAREIEKKYGHQRRARITTFLLQGKKA
jgi:hypothetical protein